MLIFFLFHFHRFASSKSGKIYLHTDIRMIIFRKSDLDTATDHNQGKGYELRSFTKGPTNPKFSPRKWKQQKLEKGTWFNATLNKWSELYLSHWKSQKNENKFRFHKRMYINVVAVLKSARTVEDNMKQYLDFVLQLDLNFQIQISVSDIIYPFWFVAATFWYLVVFHRLNLRLSRN